MSGEDVFRFEDYERDLRFHPIDTSGGTRLNRDQLAAFNRQGYLSPLPCLSAAEVDDLRLYMDRLIETVVSAADRRNSYSINNYHRVCRRLHDLVRTPTLVDYVTDVLGPEAVCWSVHAFAKLPHDGMAVPLHQDANYWPFTPSRSVTAWLAVDDVTVENAAIRFVPGSHLSGPLDHDELALDGSVVLNRRVADHERFANTFDNELRAGELSLHTDLLLHGSDANSSDQRRCGIALRYLGAEVRTVPGAEAWASSAVHVGNGDPSGYWPDLPRPDGEEPNRMARFVGGFDGNR